MGSDEVASAEAKLATVSYLFGTHTAELTSTEPASTESSSAQPSSAQSINTRSIHGRSINIRSINMEGQLTAKVNTDSARAEHLSIKGLTRRNLSKWEIQQLLQSRDIDAEVIAAELGRLEDVGLIDDAALAEILVRTQHERKGLGRSAIALDLRRRHIDQQYIDQALATLDVVGEQERAVELAVKRAGQLRSYDRETATRRLTAFLMRKGYSSSVVRLAVGEAMSTHPGTASASRVSFR